MTILWNTMKKIGDIPDISLDCNVEHDVSFCHKKAKTWSVFVENLARPELQVLAILDNHFLPVKAIVIVVYLTTYQWKQCMFGVVITLWMHTEGNLEA